MPCEDFISLAKHSNLLIHEATMEDGLEDEAKLKFHSTISQAVKVGVKTEARFILLTHFSQRYSKIPMLPKEEDRGDEFKHVGISFDFMHISLSQLELLPIIYPAIEAVFTEFKQELENKARNRENRRWQDINIF